jgi:hypothetical protein
MRFYLSAKAEEEKRKQEEEKTRQESYRLEQRRMEHDILRTSLQGGIPPSMVPVVFAGMGGGTLPQAALDLAQQYAYSQSHPPAAAPASPGHQRQDSQSQAYGHYQTSGGVPSTPGSAHGPPSAFTSVFPTSPTRPRGQSMPGRSHGGPSLPSIVTNVPAGPGGGAAAGSASGGSASHQPQEPQPSPPIYFHHWQPPTTQAGGRDGSSQPAPPSGSSKTTRSRP